VYRRPMIQDEELEKLELDDVVEDEDVELEELLELVEEEEELELAPAVTAALIAAEISVRSAMSAL